MCVCVCVCTCVYMYVYVCAHVHVCLSLGNKNCYIVLATITLVFFEYWLMGYCLCHCFILACIAMYATTELNGTPTSGY